MTTQFGQPWISLDLSLVTDDATAKCSPELHVARTLDFITGRVNPLVAGIRDLLSYTSYWSVDTLYRAVQYGYPDDPGDPRKTPFNRELGDLVKGYIGTPHPVRSDSVLELEGDPVGKAVRELLKTGKTVRVRPTILFMWGRLTGKGMDRLTHVFPTDTTESISSWNCGRRAVEVKANQLCEGAARSPSQYRIWIRGSGTVNTNTCIFGDCKVTSMLQKQTHKSAGGQNPLLLLVDDYHQEFMDQLPEVLRFPPAAPVDQPFDMDSLQDVIDNDLLIKRTVHVGVNEIIESYKDPPAETGPVLIVVGSSHTTAAACVDGDTVDVPRPATVVRLSDLLKINRDYGVQHLAEVN